MMYVIPKPSIVPADKPSLGALRGYLMGMKGDGGGSGVRCSSAHVKSYEPEPNSAAGWLATSRPLLTCSLTVLQVDVEQIEFAKK